MLLQSFNLYLDDPSYQMRIKQTLTIKPKDFYIRAELREGIDATSLERTLHSGNRAGSSSPITRVNGHTSQGTAKPMLILYGSNTGTAQAFAQRLGADASSRGFLPEVIEMDQATGKVRSRGPVVIFTASYEGNPPDNAARFVDWMQSLNENTLQDVEYAVFGCGHSKPYVFDVGFLKIDPYR